MTIEFKYWNKELETMPHNSLKEYQLGRLQNQLIYAYQNSPYYKNSFDETGVKPEDIKSFEDYQKYIPFISKSEIIEIQEQRPPCGDLTAVTAVEFAHLFNAPGPIFYPFTEEDWSNYIESASRAFFTMGVTKDDIVNSTIDFSWELAGHLVDDALKRIGCQILPGGVVLTDSHIENIKTNNCSVFLGFPTVCQQLGDKTLEMGFDPQHDFSIKMILVFGEVRTESGKRELADLFRASVREFYAVAELGIIGSECTEGGGMHISPDVFIEILNPNTGEPVTPGEGGEICGCDLFRKAMPVIHYRTGDITEGLNLEPCSCGRTTPRLKRILGRVGDIPRVRGVFISPKQ
ncbi:MAG: AMP-binding protein, partial [Spirochaetota bacterium]|nr:AMP-binding protein [Spirochaetota bacterium]